MIKIFARDNFMNSLNLLGNHKVCVCVCPSVHAHALAQHE